MKENNHTEAQGNEWESNEMKHENANKTQKEVEIVKHRRNEDEWHQKIDQRQRKGGKNKQSQTNNKKQKDI